VDGLVQIVAEAEARRRRALERPAHGRDRLDDAIDFEDQDPHRRIERCADPVDLAVVDPRARRRAFVRPGPDLEGHPAGLPTDDEGVVHRLALPTHPQRREP
jgi:hypothetical protein